jgi:AcrR family transcriptional regulator
MVTDRPGRAIMRRKETGEATRTLAKGDETRARIHETALALFLEHGYEGTTMRAVAEQAGVSLGNAYYYFASKEHLIQAFYGRTHAEHLAACASMLASGGTFRDRLHAAMHAKLDTIEPYHRLSGVLFRTAANPDSPLNPFSAASAPVREESTALFRQIVEGSTTKIPDDLRVELPRLLWIYHMGVVLHWIHDRSDARVRSRRLVDHSVDLIAKLVALGGNPLLLPLRRSILRLIETTKADVSGESR